MTVIRSNLNAVYQQPDIRLFQSHGKHHDPFAKFDYMSVVPTIIVLERFLRVCDMCRECGNRLPKRFLESEQRAYQAIKNNQFVTTDYSWMDTPTDCWLTTPETWWEDCKRQVKSWK